MTRPQELPGVPYVDYWLLRQDKPAADDCAGFGDLGWFPKLSEMSRTTEPLGCGRSSS